jgi:signal peptidase I
MTEKLANLSWQSVLLIVAALFVARFVLLKQGSPFAKSIAEVAESLGIAMALVFFIIRPFLVQAFFIPSESMVPTLLVHDHILVNKLGYRFFEPKPGDVVVFLAPPESDQLWGEEKDYIKRLIALPGDTVEVRPGTFKVDGREQRRDVIKMMLATPDMLGRQNISLKYLKDGVLLEGKKISKEELAQKFEVKPEQIEITPGQTLVNGKVLDEPYVAEDPNYELSADSPAPKMIPQKDGTLKVPEGHFFVLGDNRNNSNDSHCWGPFEDDRMIGKAMFKFWPPGRWGPIHSR